MLPSLAPSSSPHYIPIACCCFLCFVLTTYCTMPYFDHTPSHAANIIATPYNYRLLDSYESASEISTPFANDGHDDLPTPSYASTSSDEPLYSPLSSISPTEELHRFVFTSDKITFDDEDKTDGGTRPVQGYIGPRPIYPEVSRVSWTAEATSVKEEPSEIPPWGSMKKVAPTMICESTGYISYWPDTRGLSSNNDHVKPCIVFSRDGNAPLDTGRSEGGSKRQRIATSPKARGTNACKRCHDKKLKCSEQRPNCCNCRKKSMYCSYSDTPRRRGLGHMKSVARETLRLPTLEKMF